LENILLRLIWKWIQWRRNKATNIRAAGSDEQIKLTPINPMSLEDAVAQARDDEIIEITPKSIRIRKLVLDRDERRRIKRKDKNSN
jgi:GTP-binding protein